jgi:hypothetical protein
MRLFIEDWAEKNLSEIGIEIMKEATLCYKVGAYRSAFLMSYLSFKQTIRDRILEFESKVPDNINDKDKWEELIISKLKDDDKWETTINEIVYSSMSNPSNIKSCIFSFSNGDEIKTSYKYWKNIRNSCAHAKEKNIDYFTVEQFWNYIQDDLPEYYILGGEKYLTNELYDCYKFFNSVGKDHLEVVLKRIAAFYKGNVKECFSLVGERDKNMFTVTEENSNFWDVVYNYYETREGCIDFLHEDEYYFISWYRKYPDILSAIDRKYNSFAQKVSKDYLENGVLVYDGALFWKLLYDILRYNDKLVNLDKLTSNRQNFELIKNIDKDIKESNIIIELKEKYKIFNLFIKNAGKDLFRNDSNAHYEYFCEHGRDHSAIEECCKYINWDIEIVKNIEDAIADLVNMMPFRTNDNAISNGERRKLLFKTIVQNGRDDIKKVCDENGGIDNFQNISKLL